MTGELETAVADSLAQLARSRRKHAPAPGAACANCGASLQGPYCHACGQNADAHKRSILHLVGEAIEGLFEFDGRLWRTLPALFFRPGRLARDYIEGRIARHVPPFRMFLVALLLFIFAAEHAAHEMTLLSQQNTRKAEAALATPQGRAKAVAERRAEAASALKESLQDAASERDDALKDPNAKPAGVQAAYGAAVAKAQARYARDMDRAARMARGLPATAAAATGSGPKIEVTPQGDRWFKSGVKKAAANPDYYLSVVFTWGHRLAILLLPIVGLSLALVYSRRRGIFLYDHLLVAMNILSFSFLTNALGLVLPFSAMGWWFGLVALWTPINLFQTLRGAYGSSILGAVLKTLIVWWITVFSSLVLLTALLVLAVAQL